MPRVPAPQAFTVPPGQETSSRHKYTDRGSCSVTKYDGRAVGNTPPGAAPLAAGMCASALPRAQSRPSGHGLQRCMKFAMAGMYVPLGQMQSAASSEPRSLVVRGAGQSWQAVPSVPPMKEPIAHCVHLRLPSTPVTVPGWQGEHSVWPGMFWLFPSSHKMQTEVVPTLSISFCECLPGGHQWQLSALERFSTKVWALLTRPMPSMQLVLMGIHGLQRASFFLTHSHTTCSCASPPRSLLARSISCMELMGMLTCHTSSRSLEALSLSWLWIHLLSRVLSLMEVLMPRFCSSALKGGKVRICGLRSMNEESGCHQYGRLRVLRESDLQSVPFLPTARAMGMLNTVALCMKSSVNQPLEPVMEGTQVSGSLRQAGENHQEPNQQRAASVPSGFLTTPSWSPVRFRYSAISTLSTKRVSLQGRSSLRSKAV
mmetsp:Transcript_84674/g.262126  ORF Transcript_84674/g.262126 Transcript_84674/m.262126 type:complete len:429 (-) Transcript_84674:672-1958(-)